MSCDNWTYDNAIVDLGPHLSPTRELWDYPAAPETASDGGHSLKPGRPGLSADQHKSKEYRREVQAHIIPDSSQTEPQYVWGDEGPINE